MKIIWLLITLTNQEPKAQFQTYEQCHRAMVVCNDNYLGTPCVCTFKEARDGK